MPTSRRVLTIAPMPPEKVAYALARYSRSPDSILDSIEWVRTHDSAKFLESFYFQYGHASIADLGHLVLCFEGISEIAATEIEDEQLWDGQARSSRYQDFARSGFVVPPEFDDDAADRYRRAGTALLDAYRAIHDGMVAYLERQLPRPESMKPDAYARNIAARAFDVARYCLFLGVPTGIGQVVSIRTLERQIRRIRASEFAELREIGDETAQACRETPASVWGEGGLEPVAPTLAKYVDADVHPRQSHEDLKLWAAQNLTNSDAPAVDDVDLLRPPDATADIVATLLYTATALPYRTLYEQAAGWSDARKNEVIDVALRSRSRRDDLLRHFRNAPYVFDIVMDIGAYRDLHRHRRCQQFRQEYSTKLGHAVPAKLVDAGLETIYRDAITAAHETANALPAPGGQYLLPFGTRSRFLFKMDFAEVEYICRLRTGVKGHFSYREVAWKMLERFRELEPSLGRLVEATPPWVEDPLTR
jgi:thymidylate synthase ThyX